MVVVVLLQIPLFPTWQPQFQRWPTRPSRIWQAFVPRFGILCNPAVGRKHQPQQTRLPGGGLTVHGHREALAQRLPLRPAQQLQAVAAPW